MFAPHLQINRVAAKNCTTKRVAETVTFQVYAIGKFLDSISPYFIAHTGMFSGLANMFKIDMFGLTAKTLQG